MTDRDARKWWPSVKVLYNFHSPGHLAPAAIDRILNAWGRPGPGRRSRWSGRAVQEIIRRQT